MRGEKELKQRESERNECRKLEEILMQKIVGGKEKRET